MVKKYTKDRTRTKLNDYMHYKMVTIHNDELLCYMTAVSAKLQIQ